MEIKVNNQIHAQLLHNYSWDLDEIAINLENEHHDLRDLEVVNVSEDTVTISGYQGNYKVTIHATATENRIEAK